MTCSLRSLAAALLVSLFAGPILAEADLGGIGGPFRRPAARDEGGLF